MAERKKRFAYAAKPVLPAEPSDEELLAVIEVTSEDAIASESSDLAVSKPTARQKRPRKAALQRSAESTPVKQSKPVMQGEPQMTAKQQVLAKQSEQQSEQFSLRLELGDLDRMVAPPQRRGKLDMAGEGRMAVQREQLNVRITPELKRAAGAVAALKGLTLGDVVEQALLKYIQEEF